MSQYHPYQFKRRGNENQFRFCEEVANRLATAQSSVTRAERDGGRSAFEQAKMAIQEGIELVSRRQKLIKFADQSESGWATVDEYIDDDLADDSDDEKRMEDSGHYHKIWYGSNCWTHSCGLGN